MIDTEKLKNKRILTDEEKTYLLTTFNWCKIIAEAMFCLRHNITKRPICNYEDCNNLANFRRKAGYRGCCKSHNTKLTNLEKYGVENVKQVSQFCDKAKKTYNSKSDIEKKEIQKQKEETNLKRYGTKNASYSQQIKDKISKKNKANAKTRMIKLKENNQIKYGVDNVFQLDEIKEKSKISFLKTLGVENPSQSEEIKLKKEQTCFSHFGTNYPIQNENLYEKTNKHRWKNYILPSGKIIKIQGYENLALDILLKSYNENDLVLERKMIPKIKYGKNNRHQYITDIYIPKENKFIEVKSSYTLCKYLKINLLKEAASIKSGFKFEFMILDHKGNILDRNEIISDFLSQYF